MNNGKFKHVAEDRIAMCKSILNTSTHKTVPKKNQRLRDPSPLPKTASELRSSKTATVTVEEELVPELPPPNPLLSDHFRIVHEPLRYGIGMQVLKLPKFEDQTPEQESGEIVKDVKEKSSMPPGWKLHSKLLLSVASETASFNTLKMHLLGELPGSQIVYERLYPDSLPVSQRKSLFFTELYNIKKLISHAGSMTTSEGFSFPSEMESKMFVDSELQPYYKPLDGSDTTLIFESRFESGNLRLAIKRSDNEYDLYLQNDINTRGNTQWFFFRVANTRKNKKIFFNINNFGKEDSLFRTGMKPVIYSTIAAETSKTGWMREGKDISYFNNGIRRNSKMPRSLFTLRFSYTFVNDNDCVYIAYIGVKIKE